MEDTLRRVRTELNTNDTNIEHNYAHLQKTSMPTELIFADDSDFPTQNITEKQQVLDVTYRIFPESNVKVNEDKTEHTFVKLGNEEEEWRNMRKLGSLLGDKEDIARRKQLAAAVMDKYGKVFERFEVIRLE